MQKIKDAAKRISALAGAMALLLGIGTSMVPISVASADALNPLTERSLTLSSSSPGYHYLDAAGNPTYAPAGSGNNGKQTGELVDLLPSGFSFFLQLLEVRNSDTQ